MDLQGAQLPQNHRSVMDRFVAACRADERVVAAFLGGSYARDATDEYSDLDLGLITTDEAYEDFSAGREAFVRLLGEPAFVEDFDIPDYVFIIFPDGTEVEVGLGRESQFKQIQRGPYRVLIDKRHILEGAVFTGREPGHTEQIETLRRQVYWFWHDLSHFTKAMGRGQLWWAYGQLEALRLYCINLARLTQDFSARADGYEKVEQAIRVEHLSSLQATLCPMERDAMLQAGLAIVRLYRELAPPLARTHGMTYPGDLDRAMSARLEKLCNAPVS